MSEPMCAAVDVWSHELSDEFAPHTEQVANSFTEFLSMLREDGYKERRNVGVFKGLIESREVISPEEQGPHLVSYRNRHVILSA
ncbi:MAG: hypothetical protein CMJ46_11535 [Planctomyces sp.]|nr:hypothetical protein [Planctomyces sp.]